MRRRDKQVPQSAEQTVGVIRSGTRRYLSAEEKICIVLKGLRGEDSIAELCRRWPQCAGGSSVETTSRLEPHSR